MRLTPAIAALAASLPLLGLGDAAPAPHPPIARQHSTVMKREVVKRDAMLVTGLGGVNFKVGQVENPRFQMNAASGPVALAQAYRKYATEIPPELAALILEILRLLGFPVTGGRLGTPQDPNNGRLPPRPGRPGQPADPNNSRPARPGRPSNITDPAVPAGPTDPGEVLAIPAQFDRQYLCQVQIGTPPQTLSLNIDTGSSDFWVFSSETPQNLVQGQTIYDIGASSSAEQIPGASWAIRYGDGSFSRGNVYRDVVTIGDVTVEGQAINSAAEISQSFTQNTDQDGLVGLALSKINTVQPVQEKTFFDNAMASLAMPLFTANLKKQEPGSYTFGVIDNTEFEGDITFVAANTTLGFWGVRVDGMRFGDGAPLPATDAIVDTGSTLLLVSNETAQAYYAQIPSAAFSNQLGGYVFDCTETPPPITFTIGAFEAAVPPELINFAPVNMLGMACFGGIQPRPPGIDFDILGDVFLKAVFTVFHGGNQELGFAKKAV